MHKTAFGLIGLGVMGKSISLNIANNGFSIAVYNRTDAEEATVVANFIAENSERTNLFGYTDLESFVKAIERPRKILLMIKAGSAVEMVISQLMSMLNEGDIIIDGGNSLYTDTIRRTEMLAQKNIRFVGCGISGGEAGARNGASIMPGGTREAYENIAPIIETIAAKDISNKPCCTHIGTDGAGHFVKMVHNGIEYAEMQLLAEMYALLSKTYSNEEIARILSDWNTRTEASYVLEITIAILRKKDEEGYVVDRILDKAMSKGTGSWSSKAALDLGVPATMISSAVNARYVSALKAQRTTLSKSVKKVMAIEGIKHSYLEKAYRFARIINHQQGFALMQKASEQHQWNLNLSEIARIWTNGCIIRSNLMETSIGILKKYPNYFDDPQIVENLRENEKYIIDVLHYGLSNRFALETFSTAYQYWIAMTTKNSSANLIQAQRDYFGAHMYQRNDIESEKFFHTNW